MNFLSHHYIAIAARESAPSAYCVANLLPDLMAERKGGGKLRPAHLQRSPDSEIAAGIGLHLAVDHAFHSSADFAAAMAEASALLRGAGFTVPLSRVFFIAHVFVEVVLDGALLERVPDVAQDLYSHFDSEVTARVAAAAETMLERPLPGLSDTLDRFAQARYLFDYATADGMAGALHRICRRAGLPGFPDPADRRTLERLVSRFLPRAAEYGERLWILPPSHRQA